MRKNPQSNHKNYIHRIIKFPNIKINDKLLNFSIERPQI